MTTEDTLRTHFETYGTVESVNLLRIERGEDPGLRGFVTFESEEMANNAL